MIQKSALWISMGLTAFTVFTLTSVLQTVAANREGQSIPSGISASGISPEIQALIAQREAQYIEMINQANAELTAAQEAQSNPKAVSSSASDPAAAPISTDQAAQIADAVALSGASRTGDPQLVNYEGVVAYEVPYDYGNIYVDATTGGLLFNGTINLQPSPISAEQAAQIAANYLGKTSIYRVDLVSLNGQEVFRVKFVNSDAVFIDQYGQILLVRLAGGGASTSSGSGGGEVEHED